jgi:hypothetical protein
VARTFNVGFINTKGLKSKINNDISDLLKMLCFGLADSQAVFDFYNIKRCVCRITGRNKTARFEKNHGGLVVYVKNCIWKKGIQIPSEMKEVV